jgi:hypothetical protein
VIGVRKQIQDREQASLILRVQQTDQNCVQERVIADLLSRWLILAPGWLRVKMIWMLEERGKEMVEERFRKL